MRVDMANYSWNLPYKHAHALTLIFTRSPFLLPSHTPSLSHPLSFLFPGNQSREVVPIARMGDGPSSHHVQSSMREITYPVAT